MLTVESGEEDAWFFDSAASSHMMRRWGNFSRQPDLVNSIDTTNNPSIALGAKIPNLATNLLSVNKMCKKGLTMAFNTERCKVMDKRGHVIASESAVDGLYCVYQKKPHKSFLTIE